VLSEVSTLIILNLNNFKKFIILGWKSRDSVPELISRYEKKQLKIDEFITHKMDLNDINTSFDLMHEGKSLRAIVYLENH
jgi:S-(hydroxymethyl)glutathione dehydrogenase/alcohol dehydrogenase